MLSQQFVRLGGSLSTSTFSESMHLDNIQSTWTGKLEVGSASASVPIPQSLPIITCLSAMETILILYYASQQQRQNRLPRPPFLVP